METKLFFMNVWSSNLVFNLTIELLSPTIPIGNNHLYLSWMQDTGREWRYYANMTNAYKIHIKSIEKKGFKNTKKKKSFNGVLLLKNSNWQINLRTSKVVQTPHLKRKNKKSRIRATLGPLICVCSRSTNTIPAFE